jgi:cyclophilin family peptidyl-prolyl cis-trans isomerase
MSRKRRREGNSATRKYVAIAIAAVVVLLLGWYIYTSSQSGQQSATSSPCQPSPGNITCATLSTSKGDIYVELFPSVAPKTVANFVSLANSGFYNNLVWHRIVQGFVIQTGDPLTRNGGGNRSMWGTGGSPNTVPLEVNPAYHNDVGYLGMARGQSLNSGSSQFFINLANNSQLDQEYTVFGKVVGGMNIAIALSNVQVDPQCQPSGGTQCDPVDASQAMLYSVTITGA